MSPTTRWPWAGPARVSSKAGSARRRDKEAQGASSGKGEADLQPAALAVLQGDAAAGGLADLAGKREAQPGAVALGGIERQPPQFQAHLRRRRARLVRVAQQVDQRLLHLGHVEAAVSFKRRVVVAELDLLAQATHEALPLHVFQGWVAFMAVLRGGGSGWVLPQYRKQVACQHSSH